jgi:tripeptidyl-peptidase-1
MGCTGDLGLGTPCRSKTGESQFNPVFPSNCPYFTAVCATEYVPEEGSDISGGGFSNYLPTLSYQQKAIQNYLDVQITEEEREFMANMPLLVGERFQILR